MDYPQLEYMSTQDLATLLRMTADTDPEFAKACAQEIKKRKPEPPVKSRSHE